ncbi:hypothetical protein [Rhodanobacter sp. MP7CTX1]|nr:hypothetical protein [Rhodanobacter sp. MP7CTX1]MBB6188538.1 hypothetical protein [Rhodanobacter sp. MP7CTX1]
MGRAVLAVSLRGRDAVRKTRIDGGQALLAKPGLPRRHGTFML